MKGLSRDFGKTSIQSTISSLRQLASCMSTNLPPFNEPAYPTLLGLSERQSEHSLSFILLPWLSAPCQTIFSGLQQRNFHFRTLGILHTYRLGMRANYVCWTLTEKCLWLRTIFLSESPTNKMFPSNPVRKFSYELNIKSTINHNLATTTKYYPVKFSTLLYVTLINFQVTSINKILPFRTWHNIFSIECIDLNIPVKCSSSS